MHFHLTKQAEKHIIFVLSGCGEVWYRAWFGSKRPRVRIPTLRPDKSTLRRAFINGKLQTIEITLYICPKSANLYGDLSFLFLPFFYESTIACLLKIY